jgi:hypothetical protein
VTVVRNPLDVVRSMRDFFGQREAIAWDSVALTAEILTHETAPPLVGVDFDTLVTEPEKSVRRLFESLDVEFEPAVLSAFEQRHVPSRAGSTPERLGTRAEEGADLDASQVGAAQMAAVERLFQRFAIAFDVSKRFRVAELRAREVAAGEPAPDPATELFKLEQSLLQKQWRQEALHAKQVDALKAHILQLTRGKDWNASQSENWQAEAERRNDVIAELKAHIDELSRGKAWLEDQLRQARALSDSPE